LSPRFNTRLPWVLPLLSGLVAYAIAPLGGLVWDDQLVRQQLAAFPSLHEVFQPPAGIQQWTYAYYRPVTVLSYMADLRLFGFASPAGPHALNVVYHLITTYFVWRLLRRLFVHLPKAETAAQIATILFAVHPIHTESVSWITGRSDLLATLFLLPALLAALKWRDNGSMSALFLSPVLFFLALLAKEVALAGLLILLPLLWSDNRGRSKGAGDGLVPPAAAAGDRLLAVAAMVLSWVVLVWYYFTLRQAAGATVESLPVDDFQALPAAISWYLMKLVVPWPQSNFVTEDMLPGAMLTGAVMLAGAGILAASVTCLRRHGERTMLLGLWWLGVALLPSLAATLTGVSETPVAERSLYLPSVGAALALGPVLSHLLTTSLRPTAWSAGVLTIVLLATTVQRGTIWLNDLALWTNAVQQAPSHGLPWLSLGKARFESGDQKGALQAFQQARDRQDDALGRAIASFNLGTIYLEGGNLGQADAAFTAAVAADPTFAMGHFGLARVLYARGTSPDASLRAASEPIDLLEQAAREVELALTQDAAAVQIHLLAAMIHGATGDMLRQGPNGAQASQSWIKAMAHLEHVRQLDAGVASLPEARAMRERLVRDLKAADAR
jgi:Tfp pilus assembly protein PilF